ncbi:hypothetical protein [Pseudobdellovibrio sp. HCB154]|uniref:hypothetical protein n=1 Tax=Pseudobdellovibrio sp. HCB154 TaxID=3386277 RepID=UPI00391707BE
MMKTKLFAFILASVSINAFAWQVVQNNNQNWLSSIEAAPSVYVEMNKYFLKKDSSNDARAYVQNFIETIHANMAQETYDFMNQKLGQPGCVPSTQVSFPEQLTSKYNFNSKREFESNFLKVESYTCLGKLDLDRVFETLMSEAFQRKAINGLKAIQLNQNTNQACVETKIFGLGTSRYCLTKHVQKTQNQYVIQSFNETNVNNPSAPVYFKETINVITRLANGEISLYNLMYARSVDLSFRGMVKSKVEDQQEDVRTYLIEGAQ